MDVGVGIGAAVEDFNSQVINSTIAQDALDFQANMENRDESLKTNALGFFSPLKEIDDQYGSALSELKLRSTEFQNNKSISSIDATSRHYLYVGGDEHSAGTLSSEANPNNPGLSDPVVKMLDKMESSRRFSIKLSGLVHKMHENVIKVDIISNMGTSLVKGVNKLLSMQ